MRVCIPTRQGTGREAVVHNHFGSAPGFVIVDTDTGELVDMDAVAAIRAEGLENSHMQQLAHHLTDVIGPRLTGSPGMREANDWTASMFSEWGLANVTVEPWGEFGRGWREVSFAGRMIEPYPQPLNARAMAWTGSTDGMVRGPAIVLTADGAEALLAEAEAKKSQLSGAIVLAAAPTVSEPDFEPDDLRSSLEDLLGEPEERPDRPQMTPEEREKRIAEWRARREAMQAVSAVLDEAGIAAPGDRFEVVRPTVDEATGAASMEAVAQLAVYRLVGSDRASCALVPPFPDDVSQLEGLAVRAMALTEP